MGNARLVQISSQSGLPRIRRSNSTCPSILTSTRRPCIAILRGQGTLPPFRPETFVLGVNGVELGLDLRRVTTCVAVHDLLVVGQHLLLVLVDVAQGGLDLF